MLKLGRVLQLLLGSPVSARDTSQRPSLNSFCAFLRKYMTKPSSPEREMLRRALEKLSYSTFDGSVTGHIK